MQDAVRDAPPELPEADVLELLAAAPQEPADRAAYLALIGQDAQRQALDPDGSLLALAYRAATPHVRERLRTVMATAGDADVIRVVVTGDQRDRLAETTYDELDYLGHQLAQHRRWDELRRLARDLPLAKAVAAAEFLPEEDRTGRSSEELRATIERLPGDRLIEYYTEGLELCASFSPDSSELAVRSEIFETWRSIRVCVDTFHIGTRRVTRHYDKGGRGGREDARSVLHLGDEIVTRRGWEGNHQVVRVMPDHKVLSPPGSITDVRRSSGGAVAVYPLGLAFVDPGASTLRYQPVPRFSETQNGAGLLLTGPATALATLPDARLIALFTVHGIHVLDEDGAVVNERVRPVTIGHDGRFKPALSFLSPESLAVHQYTNTDLGQCTERWKLTPSGGLRRTAHHDSGSVRERWSLQNWQRLRLDDAFAARITASDGKSLDADFPWLSGGPADLQTIPKFPTHRSLLTVAPYGDMFVTYIDGASLGPVVEVHSPHLPTARELLERPLVKCSPLDLRNVRELRKEIGDPAVRDALDLLAARLAERFGDEIALGGTNPVPDGGPHDIALGGT